MNGMPHAEDAKAAKEEAGGGGCEISKMERIRRRRPRLTRSRGRLDGFSALTVFGSPQNQFCDRTD